MQRGGEAQKDMKWELECVCVCPPRTHVFIGNEALLAGSVTRQNSCYYRISQLYAGNNWWFLTLK